MCIARLDMNSRHFQGPRKYGIYQSLKGICLISQIVCIWWYILRSFFYVLFSATSKLMQSIYDPCMNCCSHSRNYNFIWCAYMCMNGFLITCPSSALFLQAAFSVPQEHFVQHLRFSFNAKWVSKSLSFPQDKEDNSTVKQSLQISIELYNSGQNSFYSDLIKMSEHFVFYDFNDNSLSDSRIKKLMISWKRNMSQYWNQTLQNSSSLHQKELWLFCLPRFNTTKYFLEYWINVMIYAILPW